MKQYHTSVCTKKTSTFFNCSHTGENLFDCKYCGRKFVKEVHLRSHLSTHEQDNKSFECYLCSSSFDRIRGLRIHFTISHTTKVLRNHVCPICKRTFSKQPDLDFHIKVVSRRQHKSCIFHIFHIFRQKTNGYSFVFKHRGLIEGHKCQHCDKIFDKQYSLKEHLKIHVNTKEFVCETCGHAYKTQQLLRKHKRTHNEARRFECSECGQVLKSTVTLKLHLRTHTGERPYSCHLCEKRFVTQPSLIKHLRVHRNEKPHGCTVCSKRFATSYHLKVHMNTHTGEKPYGCHQCNRAFSQLGTLKAHRLKMHRTPAAEGSH